MTALPVTSSAQAVAQALHPIEQYETALQAVSAAARSPGMETIRRSAAAGNAEAIYLLGMSKVYGVESTIDVPGARALIRRAALLGLRRAVASLGAFTTFGWGGPKSEVEGIALLEDAVALGSPQAMVVLGDYLVYDVPRKARDPARARELYLRAAEMGSQAAKVALADLQWSGVGQVPARAQALLVYEAAAKAGSPRAMLNLANAYRFGNGVSTDKPRALVLLREAIGIGAIGVLPAAAMLMEGEGVPAAPEEAARLLLPEAERGSWPAVSQFAKLALERKIPATHGRNVEADAAAADEHGFPEGLGALLRNLREGVNGYRQDPRRAGELARPSLARAEGASNIGPMLWPVYVLGIAYTLQKALEEGLPEAYAGERQVLAERYGKTGSGLQKVSVPITCAGVRFPFEIYLWRAFSMPLPTDAQFDWVESVRGCFVDPEDRLAFRRVYMRAKATGSSLADEIARQAEGKDRLRRVLKPIDL